jgi:hypothetical protein
MMVHMFFLSSVFLSEQFNMHKKKTTMVVVVDTGQRHPNESQDEGKGQ